MQNERNLIKFLFLNFQYFFGIFVSFQHKMSYGKCEIYDLESMSLYVDALMLARFMNI